jgi:alpha-acetolactate decarboxylase
MTTDEFKQLEDKNWVFSYQDNKMLDYATFTFKSPRMKNWSNYRYSDEPIEATLKEELDSYLWECEVSINRQFNHCKNDMMNQIKLLADRNLPIPNPIEITFKVNF